jgi:hypothetical protein
MINSIILWFEIGSLHFVLGLGYTQLVDLFLKEIFGNSAMLPAVIINAFICGFFMLCGGLAGKLKGTLYYIGIVLYTIDALILLYFSDYLSVAFHAFALFYLIKGIKLINELYKVGQELKNSACSSIEVPIE